MGNPVIFYGMPKIPCLTSIPANLFYTEFSQEPIYRTYYKSLDFSDPNTPQDYINNNTHKLDINSNNINSSVRFQINEHLSLNAMGSLMYRRSWFDYTSTYADVKSVEDVTLFNQQYNISYFNTFNNHNIGIVGAYRYYKDNLWWDVDTLIGSLDNYSYLRNSMAAYGVDGSVIRTIGSYVMNFSYNYKETYFMSLASNISNIKEGIHTDYYQFFPSVALSWDIARNIFDKNNAYVSSFNLFANWGQSGNYPLNGLANDLYRPVNYSYGIENHQYYGVEQLANHHLRHENVQEFDYGVKASLLKERLSIIFTKYDKKISDLILYRSIPNYYGGGKQVVNMGVINVNGTELGIEATPIETNKFSWILNFNISFTKQKIDKVYEPISFTRADDMFYPKFVIEEGQALGDIYAYKYLGKYTQQDKKLKDPRYIGLVNAKFYKNDTVNKKSLNEKDMVVVGNSMPDYTWNFSTSIKYKDFSLDMQWYAVIGADKYDATRAATFLTGTNKDINAYLNDSLRAITFPQFYQSSAFVEDASFIRLKNITFSYEPSKPVFSKVHLSLSLSVENLITLTKYKGYDPEAVTYTDNNFSDNAIDRGAIPNPKAFYLTISFKY
jgi:hypothetical protein